ncbi:MAG: glycosyltransferase, partial [Patescibacteria group bacterium]
IPFYGVTTGKLRRYFDLRNFADCFRVPFGVLEAWVKLGRLKPDLVFSKGGFVAFPVVFAAWMRGITVVIHESDSVPGLSTKMCAPFAKIIVLGYREAEKGLGKYAKKALVLGIPIRKEILEGDKKKALKLLGFSGEKPVLLVMGGSGGSQEVNNRILSEKVELGKKYDVLHLLGSGKGKSVREPHYVALPFVDEEELRHYYALASLALSRAGATALAELEALMLPTLLYPLGLESSRGDQIANAKVMAAKYDFFIIANPKKSVLEQLKKLPKRSKKIHPSRTADKIVDLILKP